LIRILHYISGRFWTLNSQLIHFKGEILTTKLLEEKKNQKIVLINMMSKIFLNMRSVGNKDHGVLDLDIIPKLWTQFRVPFAKIFLFFSTCPNENVFPFLLIYWAYQVTRTTSEKCEKKIIIWWRERSNPFLNLLVLLTRVPEHWLMNLYRNFILEI